MYKKSIFFIFTFCTSLIFAQADYYSRTQNFQDSLNAFEKNPETTDILEEEFADFEGLQFYPINKDYALEATLVKTDHPEVFKLTYSLTYLQQCEADRFNMVMSV